MTPGKRVLLLNNVPAPYFDPLFETIGRESGWQLTVCYSSAWNRDVGWAQDAVRKSGAHRTVILDQWHAGLKRWTGSPFAGVIALARVWAKEKPQYLICYGYSLPPQLTALVLAMITRTPFAVMGDANYFNETRSGIKRRARSVWLRWVVRRAAALVAVGSANRMFWELYGAKPAQLFEARFAVENDFYACECEKRKQEAAALRHELGFTDQIVFLFAGRLVKRKRVDLIVGAAKKLDDARIAVVIAGAGEERVALEQLANGNARINFAGGIAPEILPTFYAMADVLVLPAEREPWGLVVNEAMASGLAVIAHRHCGAAVDLVDAGNGIVLESFNVEELADAMRQIACDPARLRAMKLNSREKIKNWSIEAAACGIIRAVEESAVPRLRA